MVTSVLKSGTNLSGETFSLFYLFSYKEPMMDGAKHFLGLPL